MTKKEVKIIPVILCGGEGSRLWPLSRKQRPKQFLDLAGDHSMLRTTIERQKELKNLVNPLIICSGDQSFLVAEELKGIYKDPTILLEPVRKNYLEERIIKKVYVKLGRATHKIVRSKNCLDQGRIVKEGTPKQIINN